MHELHGLIVRIERFLPRREVAAFLRPSDARRDYSDKANGSSSKGLSHRVHLGVIEQRCALSLRSLIRCNRKSIGALPVDESRFPLTGRT
jgi:hypothetical protein